MANKDYYQTLGISKNASDDEIKKAYRTLAKKYHPDINHDKDAPERFKEVQEAYDCLSDPTKRANYDKYGTAEPGAGFNGFSGFSGFDGFSTDSFTDLGDIFASFFGGGRSSAKQGPMKGQDIQKRMSVSLKDSIFGKQTKINIPVYETCPKCNGSGAQSQSDIVTCPKCNGRGTIIMETQTIFGRSQTRSTCPECRGTGKSIKNKCTNCHGDGRVRLDKEVTVDIPVGIDTGQQIRFSGYGGKGINGGPNGDLYIQFIVKEDPRYERNKDDLYCEERISFLEAALGAQKEIDTPYGKEKLSIPEATQTGTVLKMKGKGVPNVRSKIKGDLYIKLILETPRNLTTEQKNLLRKMFGEEAQSSSFFKWKK
ncbi:molecular chaperone DnaJ [bacterium]|nr:molecular chaperone DnaJ [bacterium]